MHLTAALSTTLHPVDAYESKREVWKGSHDVIPGNSPKTIKHVNERAMAAFMASRYRHISEEFVSPSYIDVRNLRASKKTKQILRGECADHATFRRVVAL